MDMSTRSVAEHAEGAFHWVNGPNLSYWDTDQPDNDSATEDCVEIYWSGEWNDIQCTTKVIYVRQIQI